MTDWTKIRKDFPITENSANFQSAAMSPIPTSVFKAMVEEYRSLHVHGDISWKDDMEKYQIPKPFNIVSMQDEFPASTIGFEYQDIEMRYVQPVASRYPIESILETLDEKTLAVVTSQIQYATGYRQDLLSLGRKLKNRGVLLVVNATQAFPYFPVDVKAAHIDVLSASLHKWGLTGHIGTLFFTTSAFREKFPSPWAGWLSVDTEGKGFIHTAKNAASDSTGLRIAMILVPLIYRLFSPSKKR